VAIDCLRNGLPLDQDVYDAALWSSIGSLSEWSVKNQSTCFRTFKGAEIYARIESFVSTARKQEDRDVFSELCNTFEGHNFITRKIG